MEKVLEHKFVIGVVLFSLLLVYIGGIMTRGMNDYNYGTNETQLLAR